MELIFKQTVCVQSGLVIATADAGPSRDVLVWRTSMDDVIIIIGAQQGEQSDVLPRDVGIETLLGYAAFHANLDPQYRSLTHIQYFLVSDDDGQLLKITPEWSHPLAWRPSRVVLTPLPAHNDMTEIVSHLAAGYPPPIAISVACAMRAA